MKLGNYILCIFFIYIIIFNESININKKYSISKNKKNLLKVYIYLNIIKLKYFKI